MSKPVVYLHIGLPKTGTTTVQRVLYRNEALLRERGWTVAHIRPSGGRFRYHLNLLRQGGLGQVLRRTLDRTGGERIILSEEALVGVLLHDPSAGALVARLRETYDLRVVMLIRRQDFYANSRVSQRAKTSHPWKTALERKKQFRRETFDFAAMVATLDSLFGEGNVRVGFYRDDLRGDSMETVADLIGLDMAGLKRKSSKNVTPNRRVTLFLSQVGKAPFRSKDFILDPILESGAIADDGQRFILSPSARRAALAPHLEGNRALAERFGPEHAEWFASLPQDDATWFPPAPITPAEEKAVQRAAIAYHKGRKGRLAGTAAAAMAVSRLWFARMRRPDVSLPFAPPEPPLRPRAAPE